MCACAITVLHEQWMCRGMQRHTHITDNNLIPISVSINVCWYNIGVFSSGAQLITSIAYRERVGRDGYRDQIDMGVSLHSKTLLHCS